MICIRIMYVSHYSSLYGANRSLLSLIDILRTTYNIKPIVVIPRKGEMTDALDNIGTKFYIVNFTSNVYSIEINHLKKLAAKYRNHILNFFALKKILNIAKFENIDLIHTNSSVIDIGAKCASKLDLPHIWHFREFGLRDYGIAFFKPLEKFYNYVETHSKRVVFISKALLNKYAPYMSQKSKAVIVYNGVSIPENNFGIHRKILKGNIIKIIMVGMLSKYKNQKELLLAINHIVNNLHVENIKVLFLGNGSESYYAELRDFVIKNNLSKYVEFKGYVRNIYSYLFSSDIGVLCSKSEAFGRVIVEYMMAGIPVIVPNVGASKEIVLSNDYGYIYESGNFLDLANKILEIINNREKAQAIAKNGQKRAFSEFTANKNAEMIFSLYQENI